MRGIIGHGKENRFEAKGLSGSKTKRRGGPL